MNEYTNPWTLPKLTGLCPTSKPCKARELKPEAKLIEPGTRFSLLTTTGLKKRGDDERQKMLYQCKCDCGSLKYVIKTNLTSAATKSCGCQRGVRIGNFGKEAIK